jgi:hypothetical protein
MVADARPDQLASARRFRGDRDRSSRQAVSQLSAPERNLAISNNGDLPDGRVLEARGQ